jgi:5-methylcytosine-specific restriction endonuclease McrA
MSKLGTKKKISRKGIRAKLDKLVKDFVKERDNYICQHCGKKLSKEDCHASHIIPISAGLWWAYESRNIITMCFHCHINWWHKNPVEAGEWYRNTFPEEWAYLQVLKSQIKSRPIKTYELVELYEELKRED